MEEYDAARDTNLCKEIPSDLKVRAHVIISGHVQGVGYRAATEHLALQFDLTGWVRNLTNGQVEAVFEGENVQVEKMIDWCRQGPTYAQVTDLQVTWQSPQQEQDFQIRPDALASGSGY